MKKTRIITMFEPLFGGDFVGKRPAHHFVHLGPAFGEKYRVHY